MTRSRKPNDGGGGLLAKLRAIYERSLAAAAADAAAKVEARAAQASAERYQLAPEYKPKQPSTIPVECPAGIPKSEWREAARNVELGSAPSAIRAGSDVPSDFTLRRMG
jgi:hypothetical protein